MSKQLREPHYSCENGYCAEECTYPAYMLKEHEGKLWCNSCWREDDPTVIDGESAIDWGDLDNFVPNSDAIIDNRGWVSVDDELPTESGLYPAYSTAKDRTPPKDWLECFYCFDAEAKQGESKWKHFLGLSDNGLTHWMPLPKAAKSGDV